MKPIHNMKALILIDIQNGLTHKKTLYKESIFLESVNAAIKAYRDSDSKIVFVQHNNNLLKKGSVDWEIDNRIGKQENDFVIQKVHGNAFQDTDLKNILEDSGVHSIIIGGLVTHGCVKATCLGGLAAGFNVSVLKNGHTNWNKDAESIIIETEKELIKRGVLLDANKSLNELTARELGQLFPIIIQDYTDKWKDCYQTEKQIIASALSSPDIVSIDHIGSTAIPGIKAKPTVDILLQLSQQADIKKLENVFLSMGYQLNERPDNPPPHMTFVKGYSPQGFKGQAYHVHVRYKGDWDEIRFRDYLRNHDEIAKEYEALKVELAERYRNNREAYTDLKADFVKKVNKWTQK